MRVARALLAAVAAALALPGVATAATFQVNTTADTAPDKACTAAAGGCTLREAVQLAGNADTINVPAGTYTLTRGELALFNDHITGAGARTTAISGNNTSRVFSVTGTNNTVAGVTIRTGNGAGTTASGSGGGVFIAASAVMTISNSTVSGNTASIGGGIAVAGTLGLSASTVSGNIATTTRLARGGGIAVSNTGGAALVNATISGNTAVDTSTAGNASEGGGIWSNGGLAFNGVTIANNTAATAGGLLASVTGAAAPPARQIFNTIISGNAGAECDGNSFTTDTTHNNVGEDTTCSFTDATDRQGFSAALGLLTNNGGNTNTHALLPASPAINNGGGCASADQRGVARPQPAGGQCDVGAYEYRQPTLRVITSMTNDEGGTRTAPDVVAHVRASTGGDVKGSPQPGSATGTTYALDIGSYVVDADALPGYTESITGTCAANGSITLTEGQNATCTIVENDIGPRLRVITQVVNDDGGTLAPGNFTAHVTGTATNLSAPGAATGTLYTLVAARQYTISATPLTGYTATISGSCATNGTITLALADDLSCTITLNDIAPTLKVVTQVANDAGGTRASADFIARVTGASTNLSAPGSATGTTYTLRAARQYTVAADAVTGYVPAITGSCAQNGTITLALAQNLTCTITESDTAPTLKVITQVINDDGGTRTVSSFTARVTGTATNLSAPGSTTGTTHTLVAARQYTVAADAVSGYTATITGSCAANGTITLQLAQDLTCTITLDDVAPVLTVITAVDGGPAPPGDFVVHIRRGVDEVASGQGSGGAGTEYTLDAGSYAVSADGVPGYAPVGSGACAANGTVTLALGERKTCTITNVAGAPTLNVITQVINDDGGTQGVASFSIHVRDGGTDVTGSPQAGSATGTTYSVPVGTYSVSAVMPGYAMTTSGDCDGTGTVGLVVGDAKTCTVTANDVAPTLKVITTVVNDSGGTRAPSGFTVHVRKGAADVVGSPKPGSSSGTTYTLSAGTYAVGPDSVVGYTTAVGGACAANGSVTLQPGDSKTCTVSGNDNAIVKQQQLPPPQPGKNVNALPKDGTVLAKLPGTDKFVLVDEDVQIPLGTIVDVRKGRVTIVAASGDDQTADFYGGIFKLGQTKGSKPITVLTLVEKLSCPKKQASAAAKKKKKRRLWGDGKGRFRTKGKHSAATVVGTKWLVEDKCTSTTTRVARGKVRVRDFVKKKNVLVKAGKKYVARARR